MRNTYPVGHCAGHGGDHRDTSTTAVFDHFLGHGLGGHENTSDVDLEHGVGILGSVL